jgi:3-hydroxyisobutyrate dehydrogenase
MRAGFIGLGVLGKAIARRLIVADVDLIVWNRTPEKALDLGVPVVETPAELLAETEIVFLSLFDSAAVDTVLLGPDGLLRADCRNKIIVDMTTDHFEQVRRFYREVAERAGRYLECPVLGSVVPAGQGSLTLLIGGEKEAISRIIPYVQKLARYIFYFEEQGLATKMKLINNLVLGSFMATIAEALAYGEAAGLNKAKVLDILAAGAGNSGVLSAKKEKLLREDWEPHFSVALIDKDLAYLQDLVNGLNISSALLSAVRNVFDRSMAENASLDFSAVYNTISKAKTG